VDIARSMGAAVLPVPHAWVALQRMQHLALLARDANLTSNGDLNSVS
jgi:hypothetical protein